MKKVLGVSGSPVANSNTDRAVMAVLEATGLATEFVKLVDYTVAPCKACLGCVETNRCVINDDGIPLAEKVKAADALVIGGFTPYSSLDSRTKAFIERLYPLRHNHGFMAGKPGAAVITSCVPEDNKQLPPAAEMGVNSLVFYMMEEGMKFVGALKLQGNVPCVRCGYGDRCTMSGITMLYGPMASVDSVGIKQFEQQAIQIDGARELGGKIAEAIAATAG
ncbi:MAG: flavodoxin family protein [Deltaproteobacteria bacterium]|nr:flavodoxin family protein [Deltaproteobacteria bacterium]TLN04109.1 MAG: flavodoxin family protein [bacterium]